MARRLRNCAAGYVERIADKEYMMVALVQTLTGKPLALGGLWIDEDEYISCAEGLYGIVWDQVVEHSNGSPSTETFNHFAVFLAETDREILRGVLSPIYRGQLLRELLREQLQL